MFSNVREQWFSNIRGDVLSGIVVALALIPEAIAFSIIAGVDPKVGLYASFCIAVVISFVGGRPGMISAATGAMALLMVTLVKEHGLEYLLAATILTGVIQIVAGFLKLGALMRFVSKSVVIGFVNALAILIFMAQLPELTNVTWHVYAMTAVGLGIIYLFPLIPKIGSLIPSPLVTIVVLTIAAITLGLDIRTVGDMGQLPDTLPVFLLPDIPLNLETLTIIFPYAAALAAVGLLESMMTATIVDDLTDTSSDKNRECKGQGVANIASGFMGGMAGCAMIGQSIINVKSGGRTRLSTFCAGIFLLIMVVFISDWLKVIPMAALVAVMIMVSIGTFNWDSLRNIRQYPLSSNIVMIATVVVVVATHNLAYGVLIGVLLSALFFANKIERYMAVQSVLDDAENTRTYIVKGQVFFSSADKFTAAFDFKEAISKVVIDVSQAHFWDVSAVAAVDKVVIKFKREGTEVELIGMNEASQTMVEKFGVHDKPDALDRLSNH
ncbi:MULTISPECIES: SulP family inorganic anion transporter [Acinetobacter]|uniref:SulP family inorganic anion transporter n=1 Tax=Acinetobacter TaxID=469 RepID=UPI0002AEB802|nr:MULTISPECIES: SulP family inorganic anion transporter [Acinetobacter]ELW78086.1 inorganic anion transporter, SulP family [Acinetobacter baumannii WC-A-92]EXH86401.1 sulfate transporter family protein [Acinetobacter baumannii 318814]MBE2564336.1 SulP family inorganic anion transporter [Acinetobacter baumannii]MCT9168030.1 SulP family inorganic anion transporter [Acinetobacter baumannii]MCT9175161.1 SulP family inorganic anion transporter [Acinetobacter baumannii]